jgi:hypothetical protein
VYYVLYFLSSLFRHCVIYCHEADRARIVEYPNVCQFKVSGFPLFPVYILMSKIEPPIDYVYTVKQHSQQVQTSSIIAMLLWNVNTKHGESLCQRTAE